MSRVPAMVCQIVSKRSDYHQTISSLKRTFVYEAVSLHCEFPKKDPFDLPASTNDQIPGMFPKAKEPLIFHFELTSEFNVGTWIAFDNYHKSLMPEDWGLPWIPTAMEIFQFRKRVRE